MQSKSKEALQTLWSCAMTVWSALRSQRRLPFPISLRLTLLYTAILGGILLLTGFSVLLGIGYVLYRGVDSNVESDATNLLQQLKADATPQALSDKNNLLSPNIFFELEDAQGTVLASDWRPHGKVKLLFDETQLFIQLLPAQDHFRILRDRKDYYYSKLRVCEAGGELYQISFMRRVSEELKFLELLYTLLLWVAAAALLAALLSGIYISRRALRPLETIMKMVKSVEIHNLGARIEPGIHKDELSELTAILNRMMDRIEIGFEAQRRFVSDASHELRTPITIISGYANMLARWGKDDPQVLSEAVDAIRAEAESMNRLIEKLLFLARADQNRQILQHSRFALRDLLEDISQETRLIAPALTIRCSAPNACEIMADESAVKQMTRIFVENSIKYTPNGGTITLSCQQTPQGICLSVEDTGIGIAPKEQNKVFERFYRVDTSRSKRTGGTGLGLAIAKWIADEHSATISLVSEERHGTHISVCFPPISPEKETKW